MFQSGIIQTDFTQVSAKRLRDVIPLPPERPFLRLLGSFVSRVESPIRHRGSGRLTLRCRVSAEVKVLLQRRKLSRWVETVYVGKDFQHLLPAAVGEDFRLVVIGDAVGIVDLVDEYRRLL